MVAFGGMARVMEHRLEFTEKFGAADFIGSKGRAGEKASKTGGIGAWNFRFRRRCPAATPPTAPW
jgi:hypothetical protein